MSDNCWGAWPEMIEAVARAAPGSAPSYGHDEITGRLEQRFSEIFEHEVAVFPVIGGTAANALALATLVPPHGAIFCTPSSHIAVDECGAPEFFTHGAKLVTLKGVQGKISPDGLEEALTSYDGRSVHQPLPSAISITQSSEHGTVYRPGEIAAISTLARERGLKLHMDGARFANALAHLGCTPAETTWRAGVDVLSFGATKGGALAAEAVVFFDPSLISDFAYRRKRGGHLVSKLRFISAQLEAYLEDGRWLEHAARANKAARSLAAALSEIAGIEIAYPVEANAVLARMPDALVAKLRAAGARFYDWEPSRDGRTLVRLVTSFATPDEDIDRFVRVAGG